MVIKMKDRIGMNDSVHPPSPHQAPIMTAASACSQKAPTVNIINLDISLASKPAPAVYVSESTDPSV